MSYIIHNDITVADNTCGGYASANTDASDNLLSNNYVANPYNTAKIYAIKSSHTDKVYIGSTCKSLQNRLRQHKYNYKYYINGDITRYTTSYDIVKHDDAYIELLETVCCVNDIELKEHEKRHYDIHKDNVVNKNRPHITEEERQTQRTLLNKKRSEVKYYCELCDKHLLRRNKKLHNESVRHTYNLIIQNINIDENTLILSNQSDTSQTILSSII